jgi:hypothetical protein
MAARIWAISLLGELSKIEAGGDDAVLCGTPIKFAAMRFEDWKIGKKWSLFTVSILE